MDEQKEWGPNRCKKGDIKNKATMVTPNAEQVAEEGQGEKCQVSGTSHPKHYVHVHGWSGNL